MGVITNVVRWADNTDELRKNLKDGLNQIEATRASADKLARSLGGDNLIRAAHNYAAAVEKVGGAQKLTEQNQARVNAVVSKAIDQYRLLGQTAPDALLALADATKKVEQPTSALGGWLSDLKGQVVATAAGFISAQAIIGGVQTAWRTLSGFVADSVKSYAAAEAAQTKLTTALRSQGLATPTVISQYNDLSAQFQRTTKFSDDLVTEMQALLVQVGNVMPSQMEKALQASTDLASGLGIDLEQATTLVAKAASGHTETLGRYGITVDQAAVKTRGLDAVLESINKQFGGQAAAALDTYAGRVEKLANDWDNVKEAVGKAIANDPLVQSGLRGIGEAAERAGDSTFGLADTLKQLYAHIPLGGPLFIKLIDYYERISVEANKAAEAQARLAKFNESNKPAISHETQTDREEKAAREREEQLKKEAAAREAATKAAEAYAKALAEVNKKIADAEKPVQSLDAAEQKLILHLRELGLTNEDIALKMRKNVTTINDFTTKTDEAAAAVRNLKESVISGPLPGLRLYDATKDVAELQKFIDKLRSIEDGTFRPKQDPASLPGPIPGVPLEKPDFEKQSTQVEKLHRALSGVEQVLGGIQSKWAEMALVATRAIEAISARLAEGDWVGAIVAGVAAVGNYIGGLFRDEEWEQVNDMRDAWFDAAGGFDAVAEATFEATGSLTKLQKVLDAKTVEAYNKALKDLEETLNHQAQVEREASSRFGPSKEELQDAAKDAREVYEYMRDSGLYTAEQIELAFIAMQEALAAAGDDVAKAWIEAHKQAKDASSDAMKAMEKDLQDLIAKRDSLQKSVDAEAKEEHMGVVEEQQREELKALDEQLQQKANEYAKLAKETGQAMADAIVEAFQRLHIVIPVDYETADLPGGSAGDDIYRPGDGNRGDVQGVARGGRVTARGVQHFATGGSVLPRFRPMGTDTVPAMLTPGELVLNAAQQGRLAAALYSSAAGPRSTGADGSITVGSIYAPMTVTENVDRARLAADFKEVLRTDATVYEAVRTVARREAEAS